MQNRDNVVLVDKEDNPISEMDKIEAHKKGLLHRAFSVFLFNEKGEMLIHRRAAHKYHGAGLWTNACCSHPQLGEDILESAHDRLYYEMGIRCDLEKVFSFIYNTPVENNLIEHELDHVFIGYTNVEPVPNPEEVESYKWISIARLNQEMKENPELYTFWFRTALPKVLEKINEESDRK